MAPSPGLGLAELSTLMTAWNRLVWGFQPAMVPSSVANRKKAGWGEPSGLVPNEKLLGSPLNAVPGGALVVPSGLPAGGGMVTTSGWATPWALYRVDRPVPLSATQNGPRGPSARPQALTRLGSVNRASPGTSDTRLVCTK